MLWILFVVLRVQLTSLLPKYCHFKSVELDDFCTDRKWNKHWRRQCYTHEYRHRKWWLHKYQEPSCLDNLTTSPCIPSSHLLHSVRKHSQYSSSDTWDFLYSPYGRLLSFLRRKYCLFLNVPQTSITVMLNQMCHFLHCYLHAWVLLVNPLYDWSYLSLLACRWIMRLWVGWCVIVIKTDGALRQSSCRALRGGGSRDGALQCGSRVYGAFSRVGCETASWEEVAVVKTALVDVVPISCAVNG